MTYAILFSNKPETKSQRKELRKNQTKAERELWLIIELDGYIHGEEENVKKDKIRENYLKNKGYTLNYETNISSPRRGGQVGFVLTRKTLNPL